MRFTVVVPVFNPDQTQLRQALTSVRRQLDSEVHQLLLIDDCSTEFPHASQHLAQQCGFTYIRHDRERGGVATHNHGIELAEGDLLHFLHPDDLVLEGFYASIAHAAEVFAPGKALYATQAVYLHPDGTPKAAHHADWSQTDFLPLHMGNPLCVAACCVRPSFYREHGNWRSELTHTADWEAWCRATIKGGAALYDWPLACWRIHGDNHTSRLMKTADNLRNYLLCGQAVQEYAPQLVDWPKFHAYVAGRAHGQAEHFTRLGDLAAAEANEALADELSSPDAAG